MISILVMFNYKSFESKYQCIDLGRIQRRVVGFRNTITQKMEEEKVLAALPSSMAIVWYVSTV